MDNKKKSFLNGAAVLAFAGILCKVIGAVYKIPLRNIVGADTMGVYSSVYPIYTFLLIFSTSGIPTAISKLVAEERSRGNYKSSHRIFTTSLKLLLFIGLITSVLMLAGAGIISDILRIESWQPVGAIAPSLLFVSLLSAYRGYYQGMQNMTPTAVTQIVEQLAKLIFGFIFAIGFYKKYGYVYGAAGALLGITVSEIIAFIVIFLMYQKSKKSILTLADKNAEGSTSGYVKRLLQIAIPMTIGGAIKPLVDAIDSVMIKQILESDLGYSIKYIDEIYGFLKSDCGTLINMPTVLTVALSMALVPAISDALAGGGSEREVKRISATGLKLSVVIGLPCTVGFFTLSKEILSLLYVYADETFNEGLFTKAAKLELAGTFLAILSFGVLFLAVIQTAAGILQGIGKVTVPVINLAIGMVVKIILNLILVPTQALNIVGVPIGTVTCYAVAAVLDVIFVIKYTGLKLSLRDDILRPVGASALMAVYVVLVKIPFASTLEALGSNAKLVTALIICSAAVVYFAGIALFSVFDESDISLMPAGKKLEALLQRLHIKIRKYGR